MSNTTWRGPKPNAFTIPTESTVLKNSTRHELPRKARLPKANMTQIVLPGSSKNPPPELMKK